MFFRRRNPSWYEIAVLLSVRRLGGDAYGVTIVKDLTLCSGRMAWLGSVHSALLSLETQGYLEARWGEATLERGGRRKRLYTLTFKGASELLTADVEI